MSEPQEQLTSWHSLIVKPPDEKDMIWDYIKSNMKVGQVFALKDIPYCTGDKPLMSWQKLEYLIWRLVFRDYIDLYEGSQYPLLFIVKGEPHAKKNQGRILKASNGGV